MRYAVSEQRELDAWPVVLPEARIEYFRLSLFARFGFLPNAGRPGMMDRSRYPLHAHVMFDPMNGCF